METNPLKLVRTKNQNQRLFLEPQNRPTLACTQADRENSMDENHNIHVGTGL